MFYFSHEDNDNKSEITTKITFYLNKNCCFFTFLLKNCSYFWLKIGKFRNEIISFKCLYVIWNKYDPIALPFNPVSSNMYIFVQLPVSIACCIIYRCCMKIMLKHNTV